MNPKVLFIVRKKMSYTGEYGEEYKKEFIASYGLLNSASFVSDFLNQSGIESQVAMVVDGNDIDREVVNFDPTHIFIEAIQVTPAKIRELLSLQRHKNRLQTVRIHSKIPFLANEGMALTWISDYANICNEFPNFFIAPNTPELTEEVHSMFGAFAVSLPNVYVPQSKMFLQWK